MGNKIKQFPIPLISKKIFKDHLSGELKIEGEGFEKRMFFDRGALNFATTTLREERLANVLLGIGKIDRELLYKLNTILAHTRSEKMVGQILREISDLNEKDITEGLCNQIRMITTNSFSIREGEWIFLKKKPRIPNPIKFNLTLPLIIREGVEKITDLDFFKNKFKDSYPLVVALPDAILRDLSPGEKEALYHLDDHREQPVSQITAGFKGDSKFLWQKMITFYLLNILAFSFRNPAEEKTSQIKKEIELLSEQIERGEIDYYQVLGLSRKASQQDIEDRYTHLISRYHPDKLARVFGSVLEENMNRVVSEINAAYKVLSDPQRRGNYDHKGKFLREEQEKDELLDEKQKGRRLYLVAHRLYQQKKYAESIHLLKRALAFDSSKANYFMLLGLSQSKFPAQRRPAVENLLKASQLEPWNPDPLYAVGDIFRAENLMAKAKHYFEKALEKDMEKSMSKEMIREYRDKKKGLLSFFRKS